MKQSRILIPLFLLLLLARAHAADPSEADRDWQAYESATKAEPPKPYKEMSSLERSQYFEARNLRLRELGLAFLEKHPQDPRRWSIVYRFYHTAPRFVREWGPLNAEGVPDKPVVDEAAAAAWKAQMAELKAAMAKATDLPADVKKSIAAQAEAKARQEAFKARWQSGRTEVAPDFTVQDIGGREVKLSDYRGKIVVLDFWASWCGPCKAAMPHNQEVAARYKDQDVVIFAVCVWDERDKCEAWLKENRANYPDLHWAFSPAGRGDDDPAKKLYNVIAIPTQFIVDREGRVVDAVLGYMKGEVILDAALAKAGVKVDPAIIAQGEADLKKRGG